MRKLVLVSAFLLACGGSSSSNGGGGGPLAGIVGGRAFTPVDVSAVVTGSGSTPCTVPVLGQVGIRAMALEFTSYAGVCADYAKGTCQLHASAQRVTVVFALLDPAKGEPVIKPGSYTIYPDITTTVPDGNLLRVNYAQALATGPATPAPGCAGSPTAAASGTLRIDQVTATTVTGHLSVTFTGGDALQGDFTAPVCATAPDVCTLAQTTQLCTGSPTCNNP